MISDNIILISTIIICTFALGVQFGDWIWRRRIALATQRIEEINDEINDLMDEIEVKICTIEKLPDGTLQMFAANGQFLAQGPNNDELVNSLRSRFGHGRVWLSNQGPIQT